MLWVVLTVELIALKFLSGALTRSLYRFLYLVLRSKEAAKSLIVALFFPGTVVHELSHLFTAEILGVRTGKLTLEPKSILEAQINAGSVQIAKTGPFRRSAIGLAPLAWGLSVITAISYYLTVAFDPNIYTFIASFYLLFVVSNTMFPSATDLKGVWELALALFVIIIASSIAGLTITLSGKAQELARLVLITLSTNLAIVLALNIALLLITHLLIVLTGKIIRQ